MLLGDVRGEAIGRHPLPAKPTEGLAGRDVDALHTNSMSGSLPHVKRERDADSSCVVGFWRGTVSRSWRATYEANRPERGSAIGTMARVTSDVFPTSSSQSLA
jgi:hypothetical protein